MKSAFASSSEPRFYGNFEKAPHFICINAGEADDQRWGQNLKDAIITSKRAGLTLFVFRHPCSLLGTGIALRTGGVFPNLAAVREIAGVYADFRKDVGAQRGHPRLEVYVGHQRNLAPQLKRKNTNRRKASQSNIKPQSSM